MTKPNIVQLSEFDVTQKIIEALSSVCTRAVLFSVKVQAKDAAQIADELKLSISTVYKTLTNLEELALIDVDRFKISEEGKKIKLYKSRIGQVELVMRDMIPILRLYPNNEKTRALSIPK